MHDGGGRAQQPHDRIGLVADRSDFRQPRDGLLDIEELRDPAGRWCVEDDGVVGVGPVLDPRRTASYTLPVSSTSRSPGAIEVAKSTAPKRSSALPAMPR